MNDLARILLTALVVLLAFPALHAQVPEPDVPRFAAHLSPAHPEIGERARLVVIPPDELNVERLQASLPGLRIGHFEKQADGAFVATLHPMRSGVYGLEEMVVQARLADGTALAAGLQHQSFSVPDPEDVEMVAEDYSGLFAAARTLWRYFLAAAAVGLVLFALLALAIWLLMRWRKARAAIAALPAPLPPPIEEAFQSLSSLETLETYHTHGTKAHYGALSMLLRRYIEREWKRPAMEMSEDEVIRLLRGEFSHRAGVGELVGLLATASLAKFARMEVALNDVQSHLQASRAFLTSERDRLRAAELAARVTQRQPDNREAA